MDYRLFVARGINSLIGEAKNSPKVGESIDMLRIDWVCPGSTNEKSADMRKTLVP